MLNRQLPLSELIRRGAKLHRASGFGWVQKCTTTDDKGNVLRTELRTCALIAAGVAAGYFVERNGQFVPGPGAPDPVWTDGIDQRTGQKSDAGYAIGMPAEWAPVTDYMAEVPCGCKFDKPKYNVTAIIWHLHDVHHWTREATAEWIETIEHRVAWEQSLERSNLLLPAPEAVPV
jgi:hypothetical protein